MLLEDLRVLVGYRVQDVHHMNGMHAEAGFLINRLKKALELLELFQFGLGPHGGHVR